MSAVCVAVEHSYKDLKHLWISQNFARQIKVRKAPSALLYKTSALLTKLKFFLHGDGQINAYFACQPLTLEEYLENEDDDNNTKK